MAGDDKNKVSVAVATAVGLGAIIGAGIYVLSGTAVALAGADALIAFVIVGIVAFIVALELGELGSLMPYVKGASYSYTYNALGSQLGFITGMLRYMALATSISAISLGFGSYLSSFLGIPIAAYSIPFAIILIAVLSLVNMLGVKKAAQTDFGLVIIKITILLIFIGFAIFMAATRVHIGPSNFSFDISRGGAAGIFAASVVVFFAYSGFQSISTITDKIKNGSSGYVKAIIAAVIISIIVYALVVFALLLMMPAASYKIAADPLSFALKSTGAPVWLFSVVDIGALVATASATIAMILSSSRSLYQMSTDRLLPKFLRKYDKKNDIATNGIIVSAIIGVAMLFSGNIYIIASIANFGLMFDYLLIGFDVIHFRRIGSNAPFKMPLYPYLPIIGIIAILVFFTGMPKIALVVGVIMILSLIVVYYSLREAREKKVIRIKLFD
ncbi:MAG: amino acid permease [Candidatus Micrarchaeota archaeon]|nr:amino acid permease [Candidatus Micrarchaeota archaeon]